MIKSYENTYTIEELVYYLYFAIMLFAKGMGLYWGQWPYTIVLAISAVLIVFKLLLTKNSLFEWLVILLAFILGITIYLSSKKIGILVIIATIVGMKNISIKRIMYVGTIVWSGSFIFNILLVLSGIRTDILRVQEKLGLGYIIRYSLGSTHPNVLQISYMILCAFILYVGNYSGKKLIKITFFMFLGSLYIFIYSVSYTGIVLCILYLLVNTYFSFRNKLCCMEKIVIYFMFPVCIIFVLYCFNDYNAKYYYYLNKILNTRPYITYNFMQHNSVSLFGGGYCKEIPATLNNLDSSYVYALMHYGIVFFFFFVIGYMSLIVHLVHENKKMELGIVMAFLIAAITEPFFVNESFKNITWLFIGEWMYISLDKMNKKFELKEIYILKFSCVDNNEYVNKIIDLLYEQYLMIWTKIKKIWLDNKKKMIASSIIICILVIIPMGYILRINNSSIFIVNKSLVQTTDKEFIYIRDIDIKNAQNTVFINYVDDRTPMYEVRGYVGIVENVRRGISFLLWLFLIALLLEVLVYYFRRKE